jgi:glutamine amidotransferase/cyclase
MPTVHLLDYVAGNVRSLVNAIEKLGWTVEWVRTPEEVANADVSSHKHNRELWLRF